MNYKNNFVVANIAKLIFVTGHKIKKIKADQTKITKKKVLISTDIHI